MGRNKKYTYEKVNKFINELGYELISEEYVEYENKLIIKDKDSYLYYTSFKSLQNNNLPAKFHQSNPYTIQNIKLWCKLNDKPFELISDKYIKAEKKLIWKCLKDNCKGIFEINWDDIRDNRRGCSFCFNKEGGCLATKRPDIAKEWHPTKNGDLTPFHVASKSGLEVWWLCLNNPKHEWSAPINRRNVSGCPYCAGHYASEDYNLLVINPKLCEEWDYELNEKSPKEYTPNSNEKVWWKCKECGHKWDTDINHRNKKNGKGTGCPECKNKSKGEKRCKKYLDSKHIYYISQKTFDELLGLGGGLLSYDFYLPHFNLLIEYQGEMHEQYVNGIHKSKKDFEKQQEHDKRKKEYAKKNNINILAIWYWDFDNIEEILANYLNS